MAHWLVAWFVGWLLKCLVALRTSLGSVRGLVTSRHWRDLDLLEGCVFVTGLTPMLA